MSSLHPFQTTLHLILRSASSFASVDTKYNNMADKRAKHRKNNVVGGRDGNRWDVSQEKMVKRTHLYIKDLISTNNTDR